MIRIAFYNNKGGVGKSTATINVAHAMARLGKKIIVTDCDSQQNSYKFFVSEERYGETLTAHTDTRYDGIHIYLNEALEGDYYFNEDEEFDYELIDMPPTLNEKTKKFLSVCDYVFVPIELGSFAIQGIAKVTESIATTGTRFGGCFVNKFDRNNPADHELDEMLHTRLGNKAMKTRIPYSRVIKNSINYRETAFDYMEWTEAADTYVSLTNEILTICGKGE